MSNKTEYRCNSCGYKATVLNEPNKGVLATTDVRHCLGCKSLVEVPIEFHAAAYIGGEGDFRQLRIANRCPECNSSNIQPWDVTHPCPKCGEHMTAEFEA